VIGAYTRGEVADEQMSALAMAILLNGMDRQEISRWTDAMIASGIRLSFPPEALRGRPTTDKHSTGGVGDKITLPLAPLVAACGAAVPQLSGRGLGHTGGTLDKLESIPGWRATLSREEMLTQLGEVGAVICAAGEDLVPADKKLYALRDVTGTVEAIPLIASSIMSKKIAEGTGALVLDVKVGSGGVHEGRGHCSRAGFDHGRAGCRPRGAYGRPAHRHVDPAGPHRGQRPRGARGGRGARRWRSPRRGGAHPDPGAEMLTAAGLDGVDPADRLADGSAMDVWRRMITLQGGDPDAPLPSARETSVVPAPATACWSGWTPTRWASRPGGWGQAGRARRTRCRPVRESRCTPSPARRSAVVSR
jgi:thymidine phosphorylase